MPSLFDPVQLGRYPQEPARPLAMTRERCDLDGCDGDSRGYYAQRPPRPESSPAIIDIAERGCSPHSSGLHSQAQVAGYRGDRCGPPNGGVIFAQLFISGPAATRTYCREQASRYRRRRSPGAARPHVNAPSPASCEGAGVHEIQDIRRLRGLRPPGQGAGFDGVEIQGRPAI